MEGFQKQRLTRVYCNTKSLLYLFAAIIFPLLSSQAFSAPTITQSQPHMLVPSELLPEEAEINTSNNNLDVIEHEGRLYFSWRTSTTHFASSATIIHVVSKTAGAETWDYETSIETGKDLREPRFLSLNGELFLYIAELGTSPIAFEPGRTLFIKKDVEDNWRAPETIFADGFIPWRINFHEGQPLLIGYRGGGNIYQGNQEGLTLIILTTDDGVNWTPAYGNEGVVLISGVSETDFVFDEEGLIAVGRNEAGDEDGWGSKVCRAYYEDLSDWNCEPTRKKFDSPLMIKSGDNLLLIARRQISFGGNFDLGLTFLPTVVQNLLYQAAYWVTPKRCSVWSVNGDALSVKWLQDLPSAGDTCFPSAVEQADGSFDIYNYSSDYENHSYWPWLQGQLNPTHIHRINIKVEE